MSDVATASPAEHAASAGSVSIPLVLLTALLIAAGLLGTAYWLITFNWLLFLSLIPLTVGAYLLFTRATGSERA